MTSVGPAATGTTAPRRADFVRRRLQVIDSYVDLALEGDPSPTPAAVAARASVSRASVFRYFDSLDELRNAAMGRVFERFPDHFELDDAPSLTRGRRISRFVDARLRLHEALHRLALLQRRQAADDDHAAMLIDASRELLADQVRDHFRRELAHLGGAEREDVVVTIAVLTSVESWHQTTHSHGRTEIQTRRAWVSAIAAVLAAAGSTSEGDVA